MLADQDSFLPEDMYTANLRSQMLLAQEDELISQCVSDLADRTNETYTDILYQVYHNLPGSARGHSLARVGKMPVLL